jgi:hypothetical protein
MESSEIPPQKRGTLAGSHPLSFRAHSTALRVNSVEESILNRSLRSAFGFSRDDKKRSEDGTPLWTTATPNNCLYSHKISLASPPLMSYHPTTNAKKHSLAEGKALSDTDMIQLRNSESAVASGAEPMWLNYEVVSVFLNK